MIHRNAWLSVGLPIQPERLEASVAHQVHEDPGLQQIFAKVAVERSPIHNAFVCVLTSSAFNIERLESPGSQNRERSDIHGPAIRKTSVKAPRCPCPGVKQLAKRDGQQWMEIVISGRQCKGEMRLA